MIETITTNIIRCDACNVLLENGSKYIHLYQKDICEKCMGVLLEKIESERILSKEIFDELIDDIRYKI